MKQTINLPVGTLIGQQECWAAKSRTTVFKPLIAIMGMKRWQEAIGSLTRTVLSILFVAGIFLSGSYLFFIQLAQHGW